MATSYDLGRTQVISNLNQTLGNVLADRIIGLINQSPGGQSDALQLLQDYRPGDAVPPGTDVVVLDPSISGSIGKLPNVPAVIYAGPAGVQVVLDGGTEQVIKLGSGSDVVTLDSTASNKTVDLGSGSDKYVGNNNPNIVIGGNGLKDIQLLGGDDQVEVTGATGKVDGGTGYDIAYLNGKAGDYTTKIVNGGITLTNKATGTSVELLNTEYLRFSDGTVILNVQSSVDASIARIYEVALNRAGEAAGIKYWLEQNQAGGKSAIDVANAMINSEEFTLLAKKSVSQLTNQEFLKLIYNNTFDRQPDSAGEQYWLDQLAKGMSRGEVVARFAFEGEAQAAFDGQINIVSKLN